MQGEDEKILYMFGKKGTMQILEFLDHGKTNYRHMRQFINTHIRLRGRGERSSIT